MEFYSNQFKAHYNTSLVSWIFVVLYIHFLVISDTNAFYWPWYQHRSTEKLSQYQNEIHIFDPKPASFESFSEYSFQTNRPMIKEVQHLAEKRKGLNIHNSCWTNSYKELLTSCKEILREEEKKARLAYQLTDCFLKLTGWPPLPDCRRERAIKECTKNLNEHKHALYLAFFVDTASMCHHLQSEAFKIETEIVVNDLKDSAHSMVDKLKGMEMQTQGVFMNFFRKSGKLEEQLEAMDMQSMEPIHQTEGMKGTMEGIEERSQMLVQISDDLLNVMTKFGVEYAAMQHELNEGMIKLEQDAKGTREELLGVAEVQRHIGEKQIAIAEETVKKIENLHGKADDITVSVEESLRQQEQFKFNQEELLSEQDKALKILNNLQQLQVNVIEETRSSLAELVKEAEEHQFDFKMWQLELDKMHQHLRRGSESMLKSQEEFGLKQRDIFKTLDRFFTLYNTLVVESRTLKTMFFYSTLILLLHFLTSAKQTSHARGLLYMGICISLGIELGLVRLYSSWTFFNQQYWVQTQIYWIRMGYVSLATIFVFYSLITYRDLDSWNNQLLVDLHYMVKNTPIHSRSINAKETASSSYLDDIAQIDMNRYSFLPPQISSRSTLKQSVAGNIIRQAKKSIYRRLKKVRRNLREGRVVEDEDDPLTKWMNGHGMDTKQILEADTSDEEGDYFIPHTHEYNNLNSDSITFKSCRYHLRSQCRR